MCAITTDASLSFQIKRSLSSLLFVLRLSLEQKVFRSNRMFIMSIFYYV